MGWKKGQSGNPLGRLLSEKEFAGQLRIVLAEPVDQNNPESIRKMRRIAEKLVECALNGEPWAIAQVADRIDGKPAQMLEHGVPENSDSIPQLVWQFVHVTKTREEIENESNDPRLIEHRPLEATDKITDGSSETPEPIDPAPIDLPPPDPADFPARSKPWRPVHQRPAYQRNGK